MCSPLGYLYHVWVLKQLKYTGSSPKGHSRTRTVLLRPPSQNPVFLNPHTNSVFLDSRKRTAPVTDTSLESAHESVHYIKQTFSKFYLTFSFFQKIVAISFYEMKPIANETLFYTMFEAKYTHKTTRSPVSNLIF